MALRLRDDEHMVQNDAFFLREICISMTSYTQNAKTLNSKQGFKHSLRQELALSSQTCRLRFWIWSQLHRKWRPGAAGTLYLTFTGREKIVSIIKVGEDG
jgi:hypothetical protein